MFVHLLETKDGDSGFPVACLKQFEHEPFVPSAGLHAARQKCGKGTGNSKPSQ